MNRSPGHQRLADHKVQEERVDQTMTVEVNGETIARSNNVIRVKEDDYPDRYYFPRSDVKMGSFQRSTTTTICPFKGVAHYFNVEARGNLYRDAVWSYEDPYEEHLDLKDRLAFYDDRIPAIRVQPA